MEWPDEEAGRPWLPWFVLALAAFAGSVVALAYSAFAALDSGDNGPTVGGILRPSDERLGYWPPQAIESPGPLGLRPALSERDADLVIGPGEGGSAFVVQRYVPVTSLHLDLPALTLAELKALYSEPGRAAATLGVAFVVAEPDLAAIRDLLGTAGGTAATVAPSRESLLTQITPTSRILALVPLEAVSVRVKAVPLDGVDLVRGRGETTSWPLTVRHRVVGRTGKGRDAAATIAQALGQPLPQPTTVVATGDILQSRCSLARIEAGGDWGGALRGPMGEYLAAADLTLGSQDGSIQDISPVFRCIETTNLSSPPQVIEALTLAGFDGLTVATNHVFDCGQDPCGEAALLRTIELLRAAGIRTVGGGANLEQALTPAIFEVKGTTFGVLGFDDVAADELGAGPQSAGTAPLDDSYEEERAAGEPPFFRPASELSLSRFEAAIKALGEKVDVVIVLVQSGTEDTHTPSERSLKALRAAVDAGADLVVGNQAHWVQAVEDRKGAFIAYALGNFVFDQQHTPEHSQGYVLEATFWEARLVNVSLLPYEIRDLHRPTFVSGQTRAKILGDVFGASAALPPP